MQYHSSSALALYVNKLKNSKFRQVIWPIKSSELTKFLPMAFLILSILLNQNLIRGMKDGLLITMIRPEVLGFIKLWGEIPFGITFVVVYTHMCNIMSPEKVFRRIVAFFLCFFTIFVFFIFPYQTFFHPNQELVNHYIFSYPNAKWFFVIWGKWTIVLFYVMGELWPVIVYSMLFWQLANKITKTEEASRFYSFFSFFGQSNLLLSGLLLRYFASDHNIFRPLFSHLTDKTEITIKSLMILVMFFGVLSLLAHKYIEIYVMSNPKFFVPKVANKEKLELSLKDSMKLILSSKYLGLIFCLVIGYGVTINIIEGIWVSKIKELYPNPSEYMRYQGYLFFWTGMFTLLCTVIGSSVIRYFGWYWGAIITPVVILITGVSFFLSAIAQDMFTPLLSLYGIQPIVLVVAIGTLQSIFSKGTKYSLFDATKEMAYIPLDDETKTKGKAAVEVVGAKVGKAFSAVTTFFAFTIFPNATYNDIAWFLMIVFIIFSFMWIYGVSRLSTEYKKLAQED
jgi:AAA family ATP:ADP antiporter